MKHVVASIEFEREIRRYEEAASKKLYEDIKREFERLYERLPPDPDVMCSCCRDMRARNRETGEVVNVRLISRQLGQVYPVSFQERKL